MTCIKNRCFNKKYEPKFLQLLLRCFMHELLNQIKRFWLQCLFLKTIYFSSLLCMIYSEMVLHTLYSIVHICYTCWPEVAINNPWPKSVENGYGYKYFRSLKYKCRTLYSIEWNGMSKCFECLATVIYGCFAESARCNHI